MIAPLPFAVLAVFCAFVLLRLGHHLKVWISGREKGEFAGNLEPGWVRFLWPAFSICLVAMVISFGFHHTSEICGWMRHFEIPVPDLIQWVGLGMAVSSLAGLHWVHRALGHFFSANLSLREDHQLITEGPYAYVRHPMYTALLGFFVGVAVLSANLAIIAFCIGISLLLLRRINREELMLEERFGDSYREYRTKTGRILPPLQRG
ncbi:MAG: isoprenylcysteine carboxylmethyltransferase family protein [Verrucomicrobiota bacterium]